MKDETYWLAGTTSSNESIFIREVLVLVVTVVLTRSIKEPAVCIFNVCQKIDLKKLFILSAKYSDQIFSKICYEIR